MFRLTSLLMGVFLTIGCDNAPVQQERAAINPQYVEPSREQAMTWYKETRILYGRYPVQLVFYPANDSLADSIWTYLQGINELLNVFNPSSEISMINAGDTARTVSISIELADCFSHAGRLYTLTDGAFDVTCQPIRQLWRNAKKRGVLPSESDTLDSLQRCGFANLSFTESTLSTGKDGMSFDFGGLAKGVGVDGAIAMLKEGGAISGMVQISGETSAFGTSSKKRPFRIGLQHPMFHDRTWCGIQDPGTGLSASTSGNYEQPLVINGERFYHIFDPRTGKPASTNTLSVTIAFPKTGMNTLTDGLSTAAAILGPEKMMKILAPLGGEAFFLLKCGDLIKEVKSPGWAKFEMTKE